MCDDVASLAMLSPAIPLLRPLNASNALHSVERGFSLVCLAVPVCVCVCVCFCPHNLEQSGRAQRKLVEVAKVWNPTSMMLYASFINFLLCMCVCSRHIQVLPVTFVGGHFTVPSNNTLTCAYFARSLSAADCTPYSFTLWMCRYLPKCTSKCRDFVCGTSSDITWGEKNPAFFPSLSGYLPMKGGRDFV